MGLEVADGQRQAAPARLKVLVLDDSDLDRQRLLRFIDRMGLRPHSTEAASIADFSTALGKATYDLILIDYYLGASTGIDALEAMRFAGNQSGAATIMITGQGRIDHAVEAMRMGCDDYIMKDLLSVELLQKSIIQSMERRLLQAASSESEQSNGALREQLARFSGSSTAEMKGILASMLRRTRDMRQSQNSDPRVLSQISGLEGSCNEMWAFLGEFEKSIAHHMPPNRRKLRLGLPAMARSLR